MREQRKYITPGTAKRNLFALDVLSGKVTEPPPRQKKQRHKVSIKVTK